MRAMAVGEMIRELRMAKGWTQRQLAEKCGMADSAIRKYESGTINPKVKNLQRIATALEFPIEALVSPEREKTEIESFGLTPEQALIYFKNCAGTDLKRALDEMGNEEGLRFFRTATSNPTEALVMVQTPETKKRLEKIIAFYIEMNEKGQIKVLEQIELLAKIPEYKKE